MDGEDFFPMTMASLLFHQSAAALSVFLASVFLITG